MKKKNRDILIFIKNIHTFRQPLCGKEDYMANNNNYKGYLGCPDPEQTQKIEEFINKWYDENGLSIHHFSAEGNSREYFFTNVTRWMMKVIDRNQDIWCNDERGHKFIEMLPYIHALTYTPWVGDKIAVMTFDLYHLIEEYKEEI